MRILMLAAVLVLLGGCPGESEEAAPTGQSTTGAGAAPGETERDPAAKGEMALIFSATESDEWSRGLLAAIGDALEFEPLSESLQAGHLDLYGPYAGRKGESEITIHIAFTGLANVVGLEGQQSVAAEVLDWAQGLDIDLAWIDGDQAQLQVGQVLVEDVPVLFTGIVLDSSLFYELGQRYTGLYKRHSMSAVFGEIWRQAPEAQNIALVTDDSHTAAVRVKRFVDLQPIMPEGTTFEIPDEVRNWDKLREVLSGLDESMDAVIVTGMGTEGSSNDLLAEPCPLDILDGISIPVVTLGPTMMDTAGVTSVWIDPQVHARLAVTQALDIIAGTDPRAFVPITPEDMAMFRSEGETFATSTPVLDFSDADESGQDNGSEQVDP